MTNLNSIRKHITSLLTMGLSPSLTYHNLSHTLDVENQCVLIASGEGLTDEQSLLELRIAALYHDSGFLYAYERHEEQSCELAKKELPGFKVGDKAIQNICSIILATRVPQLPSGILEKIICDADLDYLGRDDYFFMNDNLRNEFIDQGIICNKEEWEDSRVLFLRHHRYFTKYSQETRDPKKLSHLAYLSAQKGN